MEEEKQYLKDKAIKWAIGLTARLMEAGQKQWKHRNDHKHELGKPRQQEMAIRMNQEIVREHGKGPNSLCPGDRCKMRIPLPTLLHRTVLCRQAWLNNVIQSRERQRRITQNDNNLRPQSKEHSLIIHWQRTGTVR